MHRIVSQTVRDDDPAGGWIDISHRYQAIMAYVLCILAALCSTWLSGLNFPEQNNLWHIPVVLDFAGSAEGPHDAYSQSFANFISLFWIVVRGFTNEANIEQIFVAIQLLGNIFLACAICTLLRQVSRATWPSALVTAFLCFCYGLWGATPLGFSEIFVTYATHTQFAATLCIFSLSLMIAGRPLWAAMLLGCVANINLFMSVWGALAAGLTLLMLERRIDRTAVLFSILYLLLAAPVTLWGLYASAGENPIPHSFLRSFMSGHVYGLDAPRALIQTFALGIACVLAVRTSLHTPVAQRLAIVMLACVMVLALGAILPYLTQIRHIVLLHPLRFTSVVIPMTAIGAGLLFIAARWQSPVVGLFPAALALAGFMLKLPVLSVFGFALAIPVTNRKTRMLGLVLSLACLFAFFLPAPEREISDKVTLAFLLICLLLASVALLEPASAPLPFRMVAAVLGALTVFPLSSVAYMAILLCGAAMTMCFGPSRWRPMASVAACAAALLILMAVRDEPFRLAAIGAGTLIVGIVPLLASVAPIRQLAKLGLGGLVTALMLLGLSSGVRDRCSPMPTAQQRDFLDAQRWARANTLPDSAFLPIGVNDGFALMSRRPVWWESSQVAAILWQPSFYSLWSCRQAALEKAVDPSDILDLSRREGIPYIVTNATDVHRFANVPLVFRNDHYVILASGDRAASDNHASAPAPACSQKQ